MKLAIAGIHKVEEAPEELRKFLKVEEKDGESTIVFDSDDLKLSDLAKLDEFRDNNRKLFDEVSEWRKLGATPAKAAELISEGRKAKETLANSQLSEKELREKYEAQIVAARKEDQTKIETLQEKLDGYEVLGPLKQALLDEGAIATEVEDFVHLPSVAKRYRKNPDTGRLEFLDERGDPVLGTNPAKFAQEMRKERPRFFEATKPGGSEQRPSQTPSQKSERATTRVTPEEALTPDEAMLEKMAAGEIEVEGLAPEGQD